MAVNSLTPVNKLKLVSVYVAKAHIGFASKHIESALHIGFAAQHNDLQIQRWMIEVQTDLSKSSFDFPQQREQRWPQ